MSLVPYPWLKQLFLLTCFTWSCTHRLLLDILPRLKAGDSRHRYPKLSASQTGFDAAQLRPGLVLTPVTGRPP